MVEAKEGSMRMITTVLILFGVSSMVLTSGCLVSDRSEELDLVVVSIAPQKEVVEKIAGEDIEVVVMVPENVDPHIYSPTTGQLLKVSDADIYFELGSGIEFEELNMDTLKETNSAMKVFKMSEGVPTVSFEDHGIDGVEEDEHDHEGTDPHIWLDPLNMKIMAENVLDALIEEDPDNEGKYQTNYMDYVSSIDTKIQDIKDLLLPYANRSFLSYHPAWGYFADAFELVQIAVEDEGKEPGPQGIAKLIQQAKDENVTVVFVELQFDTSSAEQIADAIDGSVVRVDPLASDYLGNLWVTAQKMADAFENG
jgi:zinc transport system substrate-binding protein